MAPSKSVQNQTNQRSECHSGRVPSLTLLGHAVRGVLSGSAHPTAARECYTQSRRAPVSVVKREYPLVERQIRVGNLLSKEWIVDVRRIYIEISPVVIREKKHRTRKEMLFLCLHV